MATSFSATFSGFSSISPGSTRTVTLTNSGNSAIDVFSVAISARTANASASVRVRVTNAAETLLYHDSNITVLPDTVYNWYTIPLQNRIIVESANGGFAGGASSQFAGDNNKLKILITNNSATATLFTNAGEFVGDAVFDPGWALQSPTGGTTALRVPTFSWQYKNSSGINLGLYRLTVQTVSGAAISQTGNVSDTSAPDDVITRQHTSANFPLQFTELSYGGLYRWNLYEQYTYTEHGHNSVRSSTSPWFSFSVPAHQPTVTITAPLSGGSDLTPELVATFNDSLGHTRQETQWEMYEGTTLLGSTVADVNSLNVTYDPSNLTVWSPGGANLQFGHTYTVRMRALDDDGQWSSWASRTFSIMAYAPVAQNITPTGKVDTLLPTITASYFSSLGQTKEAHRIQILDSTKTNILGDTGVVEDATVDITLDYANTWLVYTPLEWGTTYTIRVYMTDAGDVTGFNDQTFSTNAAPTQPTNMSPGGGQTVYTRTPGLSATFNDPNAGDTPSIMEVVMQRISDGVTMFQRTEAGTDTSFTVFLADNLAYDESYQWRVRFYDQGNLVGAWSPWDTFNIVEGMSIELTNPTPEEVLTTPVQTFTWTYTHPQGTPQSSGRIRIYAETGNIPLYDSGIVAGTYTSQDIPASVFANGRTYRVRVDATDQSGETGSSGYIFFYTEWDTPVQPADITATTDSNTATVQIGWTPVTLSNIAGYSIYRRPTTGEVWTEDYTAVITSDADDAYGLHNAFTASGAALFVGDNTSTAYDYWTSVRFSSVSIPAGVAIIDARLVVTASVMNGSVLPETVFHGEADFDPTAIASLVDYQSRDMTEAEIPWTPESWIIGNAYASPNLASIVQEIIDQEGWTAGNAMQLFWQSAVAGWGGVTTRIGVTSYSSNPAAAPQLVVTYRTIDPVASDQWVLVDTIEDQNEDSYVYYFAPHNAANDYSVATIDLSTGTPIESNLTNYVSATLSFPNDTWLMDALEPNVYNVRLRVNPTRSDDYQRATSYHQALGRTSPTLHIGHSYTETLNTTFLLRAPYDETEAMIREMIARGNVVLYKDSRGRRRWVALTGYSISDNLPNSATITLNMQTIDAEER